MVPRTAAARAALLIVAAAACAAVAAGEDLAGTPPGGESAEAAGDKSRVGGRGFGENVDWFSFAAGIREAEATQRPAMVVIHKSWCGACKSLGPKFAASEDIMARASNFVMINVHDDEEPNDEGWRPDGGYIPRILMYDGKHGEMMLDIQREGANGKHAYYFSTGGQIVSAMDAALARLQRRAAGEQEAELRASPDL